MELLILLSICIVQNIAIFLDNYAVFNLIANHIPSKTASLYAKKQQVDFISRGFLFFTPPLLGFALIKYNLNFLINVLFFTSLISFFITFFQSYNFIKKIKLSYKFRLSNYFIYIVIFGSVIFSLHLFAPFYLNLIAYFYKEESLWIVQISPALTVFSTAFIVYYLDPTIAKFIDTKRGEKNINIIYEMISVRIVGRGLIVIMSLFLIKVFL